MKRDYIINYMLFELNNLAIKKTDIYLNQDEINTLKKYIERVELEKNEIITLNNDDYIYFVEQGILANWINCGNKKRIIHFSKEGEFVNINNNLNLKVQAIKVTCMWRINRNKIEKAFNNSHKAFNIYKLLWDNHTSILEDRIACLLSSTLKERYLNLYKNLKEYINYIPNNMIAQYLGTTPQTLSRIKNQ